MLFFVITYALGYSEKLFEGSLGDCEAFAGEYSMKNGCEVQVVSGNWPCLCGDKREPIVRSGRRGCVRCGVWDK